MLIIQSTKWPYYDVVQLAEDLGINHRNKEVDEICYDKRNLIITSPAYNYAVASSFDVSSGIDLMIAKLVKVVNRNKRLDQNFQINNF